MSSSLSMDDFLNKRYNNSASLDLKIQPRDSWTNVPYGSSKMRNSSAKYVFFGYTRKQYSRKESPGSNPTQHMIQQELEHLLAGDIKTGVDIRYNFLLGTDGKVYEGRGWDYIPRLPVSYYKYNLDSYYITIIGEFKDGPPAKEMFLLRKKFLEYGVLNGYIKRRFCLITLPDQYGHNLLPESHMY